MADDPAQYNMEGESRELTVLFVDVRGFTTISEGLEPKDLREYINLYLTAMSEDIRDRHQGTLDKYIGDAVMAFWGAPVAFADHAARAVATSLLMQASAARLNKDFLARGWPALKIGIGINTGMMHVGDMGSKIRQAYTVMGDAVNLGSRLEGITKVYGVGIAVGAATRDAAPASSTASWTGCGSRARTCRWRSSSRSARRAASAPTCWPNWTAGTRRWRWCARANGSRRASAWRRWPRPIPAASSTVCTRRASMPGGAIRPRPIGMAQPVLTQSNCRGQPMRHVRNAFAFFILFA